MKFSDVYNIGVAMQVWAIHDDYDLVKEDNYISVTKLLKPIRSTILSARIDRIDEVVDISDFISRALGTAIHASVEKAWEHYRVNLKRLGYPQNVIDAVLLNPEPEELYDGCIPVYIEQRAIREIAGFKVGGKFDMVIEGIVSDNKSTSTYKWMKGDDEDYRIQGSCYRWLNPDKITEDFMRVNYLFTDWQKFMARQNPSYPQQRVQIKEISLMSYEETETWITQRLTQLKTLWNADQKQLPRCTNEELWMPDPEFKYYANPEKTDGRSTKNFDDRGEAYAHLALKGVGIIKEIQPAPKRCEYCDAWDICDQRKEYFPDPA